MKRMSNVLKTGCLFLLAGGWGYSGQALWADTAASVNPLDKAVAAAAATPATAPAADATAPASDQPLSAPTVNIDADGSVKEFNAQDLDINTALHFLSLQSHRNIILSKDVKGTVTVNLYSVTFAEALDSLLRPNGFDYIEKGNFIYVYTNKEIDEIKKRDRKTVNKIFRLRYVNANDASTLIKPLLSSSGQVALTPAAVIGIPEGATDTGGNQYATDDTLVINDYPENLDEISKAMQQIDVRPKQVLIEATILRASLTDDNGFGVDFNTTSGISLSGLTSAAGITAPQGSYSQVAGQTSAAHGGTQTSTGTNFAGQVPNGGLSFGFLSNNVNVFIRAMESVTNTTVVANPKILAVNKHRGEVFIGNHSGYLTTTTTQTTTQQTVQFLDTGTKLIFRPFIGDDGYVRLEVHPEDSSGSVTNGLPTSQTTEVTSNIMVKDGRTVIIGGLFREQTTNSKGQIPVIGDIPVLGVPFRNTNDNTQRSETMMLLTPHIINDDTALYAQSQAKQEDMSRMMIGNRRGLQPWGQDRLAQLWYSKALEASEKGDKEKAEMFADWATNANPTFTEAIRLKEKLSNKKVTEAPTSSISSFVRDVVAEDRNLSVNHGSGHYEEYPATQPAVPAAPPAAATTAPAK